MWEGQGRQDVGQNMGQALLLWSPSLPGSLSPRLLNWALGADMKLLRPPILVATPPNGHCHSRLLYFLPGTRQQLKWPRPVLALAGMHAKSRTIQRRFSWPLHNNDL